MSASISTLYQLSEEGNLEELEELLSENSFSQTSLDEALERAVVHCLSASDHVQCIEMLITNLANANHTDVAGVSLLMKAAKLGQIQLVESLLARGADLKYRDPVSKTALHHALESDFGDNGDVVLRLLAEGVEINVRDQFGAMEVHKAAERGYTSSLTHILEARGLVNAADEAGNTPLHLAVANQHSECARILLTHGAKTNLRNKQGLTVGSFAGAEVLSILGSEIPDSNSSDNGDTVDKSAQTYGELEKAQEVLAELNVAIAQERNKRVAIETALSDLKCNISKIAAEKAQFEEESHQKCQSLLTLIEQTKKERTTLEATLKTQSPSILFPLNISQIYTPEELETSLEKDIADLCTQVDAWQVKMQKSHEDVISYWKTLVQEVIPGASVHVYGSYANLLHLPASDIDFVISDSPYEVVETLELLSEKVSHLHQIRDQRLITTAVIPVLRLNFLKSEVKVDLTVQEPKHRGLKCTQVCKELLQRFTLLRKVFFALKFLLHYCEANEAFKGGLGSYGLLLMIASLMDKGRTYTGASTVIDFFKYYVHECDFLQTISVPGEENIPAQSLDEPVLYVPDPSHPQSNVARSANLEFLLHFLQVAEQKLWTRPFCGCSIGPLSLMVLETREWMCRS